MLNPAVVMSRIHRHMDEFRQFILCQERAYGKEVQGMWAQKAREEEMILTSTILNWLDIIAAGNPSDVYDRAATFPVNEREVISRYKTVQIRGR